MTTRQGNVRGHWRLGRLAVIYNQIDGIPCQVVRRMASEAVGGRVTRSVDNNVSSASSRFDVGPKGNGPCRVRCHIPSLNPGCHARRHMRRSDPFTW